MFHRISSRYSACVSLAHCAQLNVRAWPDWTSLLYPAGLAAGLGALSAAMFRRQSPWIVDEL